MARELSELVGVPFADLSLEEWDLRDAYFKPRWVLVLRALAGKDLCHDGLCNLSGRHPHVGPCVACKCGMQHAIDECPGSYAGGEPTE